MNTQDLNLTTENSKKAYKKLKAEIDKFMLKNEVNTDKADLDEILNALIRGLPSFISTIGKTQHSTHEYSVDIHTLKVLQNALNNPLYNELSDEGKIVLKLSALLHDTGKNGNVRDEGHAIKSAKYAEAILNKFNIKEDVKSRIIDIIENHHWFGDYNTGRISEKRVAAWCRLPEDFIIYQILAKADLENVNKSFNLEVTNTASKREFDKYYSDKIDLINKSVKKIQQNANFIFHTKILNKGAKFPKKVVKLKNGEKIELRVLNLNNLPPDTDLEPYGFPRGTTKEKAAFLIHMTTVENNFDIAKNLIKSPLNHSVWSSTLINLENLDTYNGLLYGFIFDVNQENISEAYPHNVGSGTHKNMDNFEEILFDFNNEERTFVKNNLIKELRYKGIWLNNSDYEILGKYLVKKKYITAIKKDIKIGNKRIKAKTLVKCLENSRDSLFSKKHMHNEIVVLNPKIQGMFAKQQSLSECNEEFLRFAHKNNLPIILMS